MARITILNGSAASCLGLAARPDQDPRCVAHAFEHGINFFFTFGPGNKPFIQALRRLLRTKRDQIIVATGSGGRKMSTLITGRRMLCKLLGVDVLDVFLAEYIMPWESHRPIFGRGGVLDHMQQCKAEGAVRFVGASVHDRPLARKLAEDRRIDLLMHRFNIAHRKAIREVFPTARRRKTPVLAFTATRWGTLLRQSPNSKLNPPTAADCYRYCLAHRPVALVLTAPRTVQELNQNLTVLDAPPMARRERLRWERFGDAVYGKAADPYETRWP
jgi:aryl-alcohol dehydrogenase-like predicted oxidoreductase